jgi:hypothetical protein
MTCSFLDFFLAAADWAPCRCCFHFSPRYHLKPFHLNPDAYPVSGSPHHGLGLQLGAKRRACRGGARSAARGWPAAGREATSVSWRSSTLLIAWQGLPQRAYFSSHPGRAAASSCRCEASSRFRKQCPLGAKSSQPVEKAAPEPETAASASLSSVRASLQLEPTGPD